MLDDTLRGRLARLADQDEPALDDAARERIVRSIGERGPSLVRAARMRRVATVALGPLLAAAAGFAAWNASHPGSGGTSAVESGSGLARTELAVRGAQGPAGARACERRAVPAGAARGFVAVDRGLEADLGPVAIAKTEPGTSVRVQTAEPCNTVFALETGTVLVHAKDLGGGTLSVVAPGGKATVVGTMFAVTQAKDAFIVEVIEGRVMVSDRTGEHLVGAGQRLFLSGVGLAEGRLSPDRERALGQRLGAPDVLGIDTLPLAASAPSAGSSPAAPRGRVEPGQTQPEEVAAAPAVELAEAQEPTVSADPLAEAERARKAGQLDRARELYRSVAGGQGPSAEAAWVALARMELGLGRAAAAIEATKQRQGRFGQGSLAPEALWIEVRAHRQLGNVARARELASDLMARWPASPQAKAASQWLSGGGY